MLVPTDETAQDIRAGLAPRYNLLYQREDGAMDLAPDLFQIGTDELKHLAALESEKRQIEFEEARAREEGKGERSAVVDRSIAANLIDMFTGDAPGTDERRKRLEEIETERNTVLGRPAPDGGLDAEFMDKVQQYQTGDSFGAFGAPIGGQQ
jgi:hypothetical protein